MEAPALVSIVPSRVDLGLLPPIKLSKNPSIAECVVQTEIKLRSMGVESLRIIYESTPFIVFAENGMLDRSSPGIITLPREILGALSFVSQLSYDDRKSQCASRTEDLVERGLVGKRVWIGTTAKDNIRGIPGDHYIGEITLENGSRVYIDPTWPTPDTPAEQTADTPHGIIIIGSADKAYEIARVVYGGRPKYRE